MSITPKITGKVFALSALALAINTSLHADVAPELTLGETITVTGTADAAPVACTGTSPTISCPSLRSAVAHANGNANAVSNKYDVINLPAGTYNLTVTGTGEDAAEDGDLDITEAVEIYGAGADTTTIDGGGDPGIGERIFTIHGVAAAIDGVTMTNGFAKHELGGAIFNDEKSNLTLSNCAITNSTATWDGDYTTDTDGVSGDGTAENPEGTVETQGSGGAIYSKDVMNIDNCVFRGNVADNRVQTTVPDPDHDGAFIEVKVGNGGAINASQYTEINNSTFGSDSEANMGSDANRGINGGALFMTGGNELIITNSTFSYNDAISGGGINNVSPSAPTTITNTTISGNHVTDSGAGVETNAQMTLTNVTIANNMKDSNNKGAGFNTGPSVQVTFRNVLLDNNMHDENTGFTESSNCGLKSPGTFNVTSLGGNVSSDDTCQLNVNVGDQENVDPQLEALADNNGVDLPGTTLTHALPLASAAVDSGVNTGCPNNDQRGSIRPFDATLLLTAICDSGAYELYVERTDLHIENMTAPDKVAVGEDVTINVVVDNGDTNPADNVKLKTNLPAELTFVSATPTPGSASCAHTSGVVSCDFGTVAAGAEVSAAIVATADTAKAGVIVGTEASSDTLDPNYSNNLASVTFGIVEVTDMSLTAASASPTSLSVGGTSTISITALNRGPAEATGVKVSGVMPSLVSFVQGIGCSEANGIITCNVGTLAKDATADVVFEVKAEAAGTASVTAAVDADQVDSDPSDNSGTVVIAINAVSSGSSGGGFCSYNPDGRFDPVLPALVLMALAFLGFRKLRGEEDR